MNSYPEQITTPEEWTWYINLLTKRLYTPGAGPYNPRAEEIYNLERQLAAQYVPAQYEASVYSTSPPPVEQMQALSLEDLPPPMTNNLADPHYNANILIPAATSFCNQCRSTGHTSISCNMQLQKKDIYTTHTGQIICFVCKQVGHKHYIHQRGNK